MDIRKAVELADGWIWRDGYIETPNGFGSHPKKQRELEVLDALAAQLVRQVDAKYPGDFENDCNGTAWLELHSGDGGLIDTTGSDRTENTIKAIVDSGVLANLKGEDHVDIS